MSRPTSFRLPDGLLARVDAEAAASGTSVTALVTSLLDEGLKSRRFPGVVYRGGPTGRRAGLVRGPDVWEVIRAVRAARGRGERRLQAVADGTGLAIDQVRLAVDFYTAFPDEIEARIAADERAAVEVCEAVQRRERLLTS